MRTRILLAVCTLLACNLASAQSMSYADADTPGEAVGIMNTTLVAARKLLSECSVRFPSAADAMANDFKSFQVAEAMTIKKTEYHWARAVERDVRLAEVGPYVERVVVRNIENVADAPTTAGSNVAKQYCEQHFKDLGSGIWRTRTPRAYRFIDQAPPVFK